MSDLAVARRYLRRADEIVERDLAGGHVPPSYELDRNLQLGTLAAQIAIADRLGEIVDKLDAIYVQAQTRGLG